MLFRSRHQRGPSDALRAYHLHKDGMLLHDVGGVYRKWSQLLKIKAQVPSIWAKGCILDNVRAYFDCT